MPYKRCILILVDGSRPDVFHDLIQQGELPHIARHFAEPFGLHHAVSCFPSTTGPAYLPFLMGSFPGTAAVPGIRWMDKTAVNGRASKAARSYMGYEAVNLNKDIADHAATLFEIFDNPHNIYNMVTRGLSKSGDLTRRVKPWLYAYAHFTEKWRPVDQVAQQHLLSSLDSEPDFLFAVFPGVDSFTHLSHPRDEEVLRAYRVVDDSIGLLTTELAQRGWLEESAIFIISDHGLTATHTHFDTVGFLDGLDWKAMHYPLVFRSQPKSAVMVSGNAMAHVYLKNGDGWLPYLQADSLHPEHEDLIDRFLQEPAIDVLLLRAGQGAMAVSSRGRALIKADGEAIEYRVLDGDPFGYEALPPKFSIAESLSLTVDSDYPDAPLQALQIFRTSRSGDLVLSATKGFDLRLAYEWPEHKSSHGSLHREHLLVPVLANLALPDETFRTVDIYPTVLKLMGKIPPDDSDGRCLI